MHVSLLLLLAAHMAVAVYWDVRERRIPNVVVSSGLVAAFGFHVLTSGADGGVAFLIGSVSGLAIMLPLYAMRLMGAGDVKLMAMGGAFAGSLQAVLWMVLYTFLAGGALVIIYATYGRVWGRLFSNPMV